MTARIGVVVFPGTNCEHDVVAAVEQVGGSAQLLWHASADLDGVDAVVVPGGFAHGDYLRAGAIARFSPVMSSVADLARQGRPVVGICNGFQVLCESGLLPGALRENVGLKFLCHPAEVAVTAGDTVLTDGIDTGRTLRLPINHFEGNYICSAETLAELREHDQIVFRYVDNPNGSIDDIAGVANRAGNVVGLMPHPERAMSELLGSDDGVALFERLVAAGA